MNTENDRNARIIRVLGEAEEIIADATDYGSDPAWVKGCLATLDHLRALKRELLAELPPGPKP